MQPIGFGDETDTLVSCELARWSESISRYFAPAGRAASTTDEALVGSVRALSAQKCCSRLLENEQNMWSMAEVFFFSGALLHLPSGSSAFASTPGCESCAWSVNTETFHYGAGRFSWSCPSRQLWAVCPYKTCPFNQFPYIQLVSQWIFALSVYSQLMKRTTVTPWDKPLRGKKKKFWSVSV